MGTIQHKTGRVTGVFQPSQLGMSYQPMTKELPPTHIVANRLSQKESSLSTLLDLQGRC